MQKKKILIIEDEKALLMAMKSKLEANGYEIFVAEDGELGQKLILEKKPDLVLLDITLPKKSGFEILEDLKKEGVDIPVMIISNTDQKVEVERAQELGVKDYIIKTNSSPDEVLKKIERVIGVSVDSQPKEKLKTKETQGVISSDSIPDHPDGKYTVLVVEDDEFLREVISEKLLKEGFDVMAAIDAEGALKQTEDKKPHIILLDLLLPGMSGFELLEKFKEDRSISDIPVVILSNLGQQSDKEKALAGGAVDYLVKADHTPIEIVRRVREILGKKYV
ncbi:MAG: response regulator [Patescibacteria group bacterium]